MDVCCSILLGAIVDASAWWWRLFARRRLAKEKIKCVTREEFGGGVCACVTARKWRSLLGHFAAGVLAGENQVSKVLVVAFSCCAATGQRTRVTRQIISYDFWWCAGLPRAPE